MQNQVKQSTDPARENRTESRLGPYLKHKQTALAWNWNYRLNTAFRRLADHPILIVGCGHSGTSILRYLLARHPDVFMFERETGVFNHRIARHTRARLCGFDLAAHRAGRARWLEKTPTHIRRIGWIFEHRPRARIVWMLRDGRDVALSLKQRGFTLEQAAARWIADNAAGAEWQHDPRVIGVRYETLIVRPEETVADLLVRLDLDTARYPNLDQLAIRRRGEPPNEREPDRREHGAFRRWQVAQPLFDGRGRWRSGLSRDEVRLIDQYAGAALARYGYFE